MRFFSIFIAGFLSGLLMIGTAAADKAEDTRFRAFLDEEWEYQLKQDPISATLLGDYRYNDQLGDYSHAAMLRQQEHEKESFQKLQSMNRGALSPGEQVNYDLYLADLKLSIEGHRFARGLMPMHRQRGVQIDAPSLPELLNFRNTKDYEDYVSRLTKVPVVIDQTMERLRIGLEKNITPARVTLMDVDKQILVQIETKVEESSFYAPFLKFPESVPAADRDRLKASASDAITKGIIPAFRKLYDYWTKTYYPKTRESIALSALPDGEAWYAYMAKVHTTTDLTPKQIHEIGVREVQRIRGEMDKVILETGFKGSFEEFLHFLRTDPQFFYTKPEDLLTGYRDICKRIDAELPKLFGTLPRTPYGVREIPAHSAPSSTTAYYEQGSLEAGRAGNFAANTYKLEMRPKWEMEALSIHEAVPGHHLQISIAQELQNIPKFRRFGGYTAFVEGWGLYSESLGPEMGMYKDPYSRFGQLAYEMWRAIRLVVDTGMHVFGWDRQKAIDFFKANSSKTEHDIVVEIDRYINSPGQALAYKIGELKIKELRKRATEKLGAKFDIREFHDKVLGNGAVPLSVLEKQIDEYIASKNSGK